MKKDNLNLHIDRHYYLGDLRPLDSDDQFLKQFFIMVSILAGRTPKSELTVPVPSRI